MIDFRYQRHLNLGELLFGEGEVGDCAYLIEEGLVEVSYGADQGQTVLAKLGPGELVGEMALIDGRPRTASARAVAPSRLRVITQEQFSCRLNSTDPLVRTLLRLVLERYRSAISDAEDRRHLDDLDRQRALERIKLEQELGQGLDRGEFVLLYQPILHLPSLALAGFEALIRWNSPRRGLVCPDAFIPVAEGSNLILRIGRWAFAEACSALRRLKSDAPRQDLFMAVNFSVRQFSSPGLFEEVVAAAEGLNPADLHLEITESLLSDDLDATRGTLERFRDAGFQLVADDFGTGYSALSYLNAFPVDTLKVDRSFVRQMEDNDSSGVIVQAIASLAKSLGMRAVAEGVETQTQARRLRQMGFEYAQGFLFSEMIPESDAKQLIGHQWVLN